MWGPVQLSGAHEASLLCTLNTLRPHQLCCSLSIVFRWQQWRLVQPVMSDAGISSL